MYCIWTVHLYQRRCWRLINELDAYSITAITALPLLHHCTGVYFIQRVSWLNTAMQHCNLVKYHIVATPMLQKHSSHQIQRVCAPYVIIGGLWKNTSPDCLAPTGDPYAKVCRLRSSGELFQISLWISLRITTKVSIQLKTWTGSPTHSLWSEVENLTN